MHEVLHRLTVLERGQEKALSKGNRCLQHVKEIIVKVDNGRQRSSEIDGQAFDVDEQLKKLPTIHENQVSAPDSSLRNKEYFQKVVRYGKYTSAGSACK